MPAYADVPDPIGPRGRGRIHFDRRAGPASSPTAPLVLLGGMTQTLASWSGQMRPLSAHREAVCYEARGQGSTELSIEDCSFERHVEDFAALLDSLEIVPPIDLCGFSFGGRVSLAIAATHPQLVRRLVVTGVGLDRDPISRAIVQGWISSLRTGDLETLARVSLTTILGDAYLRKHADLIESMVQTTVARNDYAGIKRLFEHTLLLAEDSPWRTSALIERVRCPVLAIGGTEDRIAPPAEVAALAARLGARHTSVEGVGHTVPIEAAATWRSAIEGFLDEAPDRQAS
jgi:pimeloyl-ACP methyl ester carboxylesterase